MRFLLCLIGVFVLTSCSGVRRQAPCLDREIKQSKYVHKYGFQVSEEDWERKGQDGHVITELKNGVVMTRFYEKGALHGESTYTFPHSQLVAKVERYDRGHLISTRVNYETGSPKKEETLEDGGRKVRVWYEDGTPKSVENHRGGRLLQADYYTSDNRLDSKIVDGEGVRINRDAFGQVVSRDEFQEGFLSLSTITYPNGTLKEMIPYHLGQIEGVRRTFGIGGEPLTIEEWHGGVQNGVTALFQNGEKVAEIEYVDGKKHGVERRFKCGDVLVEEIAWREDRRHGPAKLYVTDPAETKWYFEGKLVSSEMHFDRLSVPQLR